MRPILAVMVFVVCFSQSAAGAILADTSLYSLTTMTGNYSYGATDYNMYSTYGTIDNITELSAVESLLSDGYVASSSSVNGIYSGYPMEGVHQLKFTLADSYVLSSLSFLSSRSYLNNTEVTLEYSLGASGWQVATSTTAGALGITTGAANTYVLGFGDVLADAFRLTMNGEQISLHEIYLYVLGLVFGPTDTPNQAAIVDYLKPQANTATGTFLADLTTLTSLPDGEFLVALDELSPEPYAGLRDAGLRVTRAGTATVVERLESLKLTKTAGIDGKLLFAAAGETMTDTGPANAVTGKDGFSLWARPYRVVADQDSKGSFFGYKHELLGVTVGADKAIGEHALVGLLVGKSGGDVDYKTVSAQTDMESLYAGLYAAMMNGDYSLHAQATWFKHEFDTTRTLSFIDRTATSSHDATEVAVSFGGEYLGYQAPCGWNVVPGLALEFSHYHEDGFSESGAGSFDLVGDGVTAESLSTRLGVRVNKAFTSGKNVLVPEVKVEWVHELGDADRDVTARFAGAGAGTFTVDGVDAEQNSFVLGVGVTSVMDETSAFYMSYDNEFASDYRSWGLSLGYKYSF